MGTSIRSRKVWFGLGFSGAGVFLPDIWSVDLCTVSLDGECNVALGKSKSSKKHENP